MSLEILLDPIPVRKVKPCKVASMLEGLEEKYRDAVVLLLAKPWSQGGLTDEQLTARLVGAGLHASATTVRRHRQGTCICRKQVTA